MRPGCVGLVDLAYGRSLEVGIRHRLVGARGLGHLKHDAPRYALEQQELRGTDERILMESSLPHVSGEHIGERDE